LPDAREQTLQHLRLIAGWPGFWEIRALRRTDKNRMLYAGNFFIIATQAGDDLIYDRLELAVDWADSRNRDGAELFVGMNARAHEGRDKESVTQLTACYADLDFPDGMELGDVLETVTAGETPVPSFVVDSGYGVHAVYLLREPEENKLVWRRIQRGLVHRFSELGADPKVAPDESRVLRLVPYANRKQWPDGVPTRILYESDCRYTLTELADAVAPSGGTAFSRNELITAVPDPFVDDAGSAETSTWPDGEAMQELVKRAEGARYVFESWVKRNMRPGIHFGIIPVDGQEPSKPTLLKPGAELVALLYGWRFHFTADLESLAMGGPVIAGAFAYICHVIDREGRTVGQGRGVAELRELGMNNANKTVKMAEKRAMVDSVLRCAALSQWFTQDLEEAQFIAPESLEPPLAPPSHVAMIRWWLHRAKKSEAEILAHYRIGRLEDLDPETASKLLARLKELAHAQKIG
jgi:hypothetical protein